MKFSFTLFEWIELIPKTSLETLYGMVLDGEFPMELYAAICQAVGKCIGV